jgi:hypothetical protein
MPPDYRSLLHELRAEHGELKARFDALSADYTKAKKQVTYFSSVAFKLKRSNMLLAAAFSSKQNAVKRISSHSMWVKETAILEKKMERWDVNDLPELMLRVLYKARGQDEKRLFHAVPAVLAKLARPKNWAADVRRTWTHARDVEVAEHLKTTVLGEGAAEPKVQGVGGWDRGWRKQVAPRNAETPRPGRALAARTSTFAPAPPSATLPWVVV